MSLLYILLAVLAGFLIGAGVVLCLFERCLGNFLPW